LSEGFERITVAPAYQLVAEAIEREILAGRIQPGDQIGTEADLVRQFGVNRSTVREGIRLLEQSGLIRRGSSRRLFASVPRYNRLASRISRALVLHEVTFRELWETTMVLEVASVRLAAERATPEQVDALAENVRRTGESLTDPPALSELDTEFHALIAEASGNRVLKLSREPTGLLIHPTTEMLFVQVAAAPQRLLDAHRHLLDAIAAGDADRAETWMRRHVVDWRKGFELAGKDLDHPVERLYLDHVMASGGRPHRD
jgi:GntR family transcriptional repressor for pyruvate dehydrogenase complex